jgi:hypothetical protein
VPRTTKRRRSTKHRGNAAGIIEARGRTGRKPTKSEKSGGGGRGGSTGRGSGGKGARGAKAKRYEKPPTWKSAGFRAVCAAVVVYFVSTLLLKRPVETNLILLPVVLFIYAPLIYYTDFWMYRRHMRKKAAQ